MEANSENAVIIETGQEIHMPDVSKSNEAELLSDSQNELQGAVIIYDNESQEGQVVKLITNIKSEDNVSDQNPDLDNVITLHASLNDSKDEENVEIIKSEALSKSKEPEPKSDSDTDDDETIATFLTSTGQQLALYAVEDSDDIFAVALYDESGEPPTNFHFLMKSDVERLIGEGAVKTVKKPSAQANKQLKPCEKKDEEIKFERVSQAPASVDPVKKKEDILEKSLVGIKTEIIEVSKPQEKVQEVKVRKKETPLTKIVTKNHDVNSKNVASTKQVVNQTSRPVVTQTRHIVTQTKPIATQAKTITGQTRPLVTQPKQIVTQARHIVTQPRQIIAQQPRQIIAQQPRQIVTQTRQIVPQPRKIMAQPRQVVTQPRQFIAQTKQMVIPARQYVNQTKHYVHRTKPQTQTIKPTVVYQAAKPQTQSIKSAVTPLKKLNINQKEKITYVLQNQDESYVLDLDSDAEILEQSTVQYILCDENLSDSELTFDELQASIQSFKTGKPPPSSPLPTTTTTTMTTTTSKVELQKTKKETPITKFASSIRSTPKPATILTPKKQLTTQVYRTYKNPKKARMTNNLLQAHRKIKQEVIDPAYSDFDDGHMSDDNMSQSIPNSTLDSSSGVKAKRSRKQQLTVVNRGDSEIIIQPASVYSEEEEEPVVQRRRGRRKKKVTADPDYNPRQPAKKGRRSTRLVEVIDIDIDESERSNVMEITLDGKKGSSDKENDVISVGDTDEEDDNAPRKKKIRKPMMQCSHCMRNFRKRRALERHVQICPKSPAYLEKLEERKKLGVDKKFKCKSCDEYFDIAVALARHVRVVHSPRKRGRPAKNWSSRGDKSETDETDESMDESSPEREIGPKRRGRPLRKRSASKEKDKSPILEGELKSEASAERQPTSSEPRRRGRPPGKRSFYVEKSVTPELEDKTASSDEKKVELLTPEPRKRGRPPKRSMYRDEESEDVEEKIENKTEETSESSVLPKKRGRPKKKSVSKDEETDNADGDEKIESSVDTPSTEPKKRGRPPKRTLSKDEEPTDDAKSTESEDKAEDESAKKHKLSEEESSEKKSDEPRRRGRPPKDKPVFFKEEKIIENLEAETETEESRKSSRSSSSSKPIDVDTAKKIKTEEMDEMEEVVLSSSQTGKLKKLNCSECGKWFSSVNALNSHQLQHRTKKSAIMVSRCTDCAALVPSNSFARHMAMQHGKSVPSTSSTATKSDRPTTSTITTQVQSAEKTVKIAQRSLRSST
ncbi:titin-like isoform X2 [Phymastichus coffea]|uniref:titin-like isoform X2 n=1 Tax=Phymastichus coffea TaxID=108790 RepID=UPI00273C08C4|nr:titin-like isoform X2 [Phymastichus coffea]